MNVRPAIAAVAGGATIGAGMDLLIDWPRTRQQDHDDARNEALYAGIALAGTGLVAAAPKLPLIGRVVHNVPFELLVPGLAVGGLFAGESLGNVAQDRLWPRLSHTPGSPNGARDVAAGAAGVSLMSLGASRALAQMAHVPGLVPKVAAGIGVAAAGVAATAAVASLT